MGNKIESELTKKQIELCDHINSVAYCAMRSLLIDPDLEWNMEWIGELSDTMCDIAVKHFGKTEMEIYPHIAD